METKSTIFYTTAQVTEMVELSDQNVRKYVRLLEDRNYEVAKDEHNRRLFSGDDVEILRELIKLAKQPGYTLETAADQLVNHEPGNIVTAQSRMPALASGNEFTELLTSVVERMDDMRHEQKELKEKMDLLISKLEQTSSTFEKSMITHADKNEDSESPVKTAETDSEGSEADPVVGEVDAAYEEKAEAVETAAEETVENNSTEPEPEDVNETEVNSVENSDESQMFEADKRQNEKRIDMTAYESNAPEQQSQEEAAQEEKGAFSRFLNFLKGK